MNSGPPSSSIQELWNLLNATQDVEPATSTQECPEGDRFCAHAGVVSQRESTKGLDTEVYAQAKHAFGALSFAMALAAIAGITLTQLLAATPPPLGDLIRQVVMLTLSLVMFGLTRLPDFCPRRVARFGQAYQVGGALIIALSAFGSGLPIPTEGALPTLPPVAAWLAVWIVVFPLVAPARPWQTICLAFASASTVPLTLVGAQLVGSAQGELTLTSLAMGSTLFYAAAGVAVVPALMIQGLSRGISQARHQLSNLRTYQLLERIGQGGMGEVWRAEHKLLKRPAAIKIVNDALQFFGARGYSRDLPLERMARDVRMFTIGGGTAQVLRTLIASKMLGWKLPQTRDGYARKTSTKTSIKPPLSDAAE